jgi:hypothetical protein
VTVNEELDTPTLVTVPPVTVADTVMLPLLPLKLIPLPALNRVTPVLMILMFPEVVTGPPDTCIPTPLVVKFTLDTVPTEDAFAIVVTLPYWSTVTVGYVYVPAKLAKLGKLTIMLPELTMLPLLVVLTVSVEESTPTLVTVPLLPFPPPLLEIVTFPLLLLSDIPVPARIFTTPVFVIVTTPVVELAVVDMPVSPLNMLYGLALANNVLKFVTVLLNAEYNESLPDDSLGNPTCITCIPEIAMI